MTKNPETNVVEEVQQTHYYPFGGIIADISWERDDALLADITVYGPKGASDISHYKGYSMTRILEDSRCHIQSIGQYTYSPRTNSKCTSF